MRRPLSWSAAVLAVVCVTLAGGGAIEAAGAVTGPAVTAARAGVITTVAGGVGGPAAGPKVAVNQPCGVASARSGVYVTESAGDVVRLLDPASGLLTTAAGNGPTGRHALNDPCGMAVDAHGNLIVADTGGNELRVIAARSGVFYGKKMRAGHTYALGGSSFSGPEAVSVDPHGDLLVTSQKDGYAGTDALASAVVSVPADARGRFYGQRMVPGHVYPLAGQDCPDVDHQGCTPGLSGDGGPALAATFGTDLWGVTTDPSGNVVIADTDDGRIRVVAERTGTFYGQAMTAGDIYSVAGGGAGGLGDGGPATRATLSSPQGVALDSAGNMVLSDSGDGQVRVVAAATGTFYGQQMTAGGIRQEPARAGLP